MLEEITASKALKEYVFGYYMGKIIENKHKNNLLSRSYKNLEKRLDDEIDEFKKELCIFKENRTPANCIKLCKEGADCIIFIVAIMCKSSGYKILTRE